VTAEARLPLARRQRRLPGAAGRLLAAAVLLALAACSTGPRKGGYYKDDGPHERPPANLDQVPDAVPRVEPLARGANKPYVVLGRRYVPDVSGRPYRERGVASWYGKKFHGNKTSIGEVYDMYAMTAAHKTLPLPSYARVTRVATGKSIVVRVNDRGPFHDGRIIDLSYVAAYKLGILQQGSDEVIVERIMPDEIRRWNPAPDPAPMLADASAAPPAEAMPVAPAPTAAPASVAQGPAPAAPAMPSGSAPAAQATSPGGGVFLQLGAFSQTANAHALAERAGNALAGSGQPAVTVRQAANQLYRVLVGPYLTREAALAAAQTISTYTGIMPSISTP